MPTTLKSNRPPIPTGRQVTAKEFGEHPEWGPCRLTRGKVAPLTNPMPKHGKIEFEVSFRIGQFVRDRRLGQVFVGDAGILVERDPDTVRGPDVCFFRTERVPAPDALEEYFVVAPDLCVEVVSPSDTWSDISEKVDLFLAAGVALVWVVDPRAHRAHVFRKGRAPVVVPATGALDGEEILPGFSLPLGALFEASG